MLMAAKLLCGGSNEMLTIHCQGRVQQSCVSFKNNIRFYAFQQSLTNFFQKQKEMDLIATFVNMYHSIFRFELDRKGNKSFYCLYITYHTGKEMNI